MPEYVANAIINHRGKIHRPGDDITLTEKQAEKLKGHVVKKAVAKAKVEKADAKEMRQLAKQAGVKNYSSKTKAELSAEIEAIQNELPEEAVSADEPASD